MRRVQNDMEKGKHNSRGMGVKKDEDTPLAGVEETLSLKRECHELSRDARK